MGLMLAFTVCSFSPDFYRALGPSPKESMNASGMLLLHHQSIALIC